MDKFTLLEKLVAFDTDVIRSTLEAVNFVANYLNMHKARVSLIEKDYNGEHDSKRATLLATLGDVEKPGIILSGHLDTTKIPNQEHLWETDPLKTKRIDDKIYGKGTTDMKGGIAVSLAQIEDLTKFARHTPIHFILTHDEEGVFSAMSQLRENSFYNIIPQHQKGCIVMEPTKMMPVGSHRGNKRISIEVTGKAAHGSVPHRGVDAMAYCFQIYAFAQKLFKKTATEIDKRFEYPKTALNISNFHAGLSDSMLPDKARFDLSYRYIPRQNIDEFFVRFYAYIQALSNKMKNIDSSCGIKIIERNHVFPLNTKETAPIMGLVKSLSQKTQSETVTYGSEAGYFQKMGIDTVICGPGDILYAHKPNEFVTIEDLTKFEKFFINMNYYNRLNERRRQRNA